MMQNVQGAAPVQWPDPTALTSVAPTPAAAPARHVHEPRAIDAPAAPNPYDALRLQAFRRDAAEAATPSTMTAPLTATASTVTAPAVKAAPAPVVPIAPAPDAPFRLEPPQAPPPIQAPAAVDTGSSSSGARR